MRQVNAMTMIHLCSCKWLQQISLLWSEAWPTSANCEFVLQAEAVFSSFTWTQPSLPPSMKPKLISFISWLLVLLFSESENLWGPIKKTFKPQILPRSALSTGFRWASRWIQTVHSWSLVAFLSFFPFYSWSLVGLCCFFILQQPFTGL